MTTAREDILSKLRAATAQAPFADVPAHEAELRQPVAKIDGDAAALRTRFIAEVERVRGVVHPAEDDADAKRILINLLQQKEAKRASRENLELKLRLQLHQEFQQALAQLEKKYAKAARAQSAEPKPKKASRKRLPPPAQPADE